MSRFKIVSLASRMEPRAQAQADTPPATQWPACPQETTMPAFTWQQLERQLADLAATPASAALVPPLVSGIRKQASFKPPEMVLREVLCLAWTLLDEEFHPGPGEGEMS